jgi:hypothetical protein
MGIFFLFGKQGHYALPLKSTLHCHFLKVRQGGEESMP